MIEKYNPLWLKSNRFDDKWHNRQSDFIKDLINKCDKSIIKIAINDIAYFEAWLPELLRYEFKVKRGVITIYVK